MYSEGSVPGLTTNPPDGLDPEAEHGKAAPGHEPAPRRHHQAFHPGLCDQHPVKRIHGDRRQSPRHLHMLHPNRQLLKPVRAQQVPGAV